jgi:hypothetical protein
VACASVVVVAQCVVRVDMYVCLGDAFLCFAPNIGQT